MLSSVNMALLQALKRAQYFYVYCKWYLKKDIFIRRKDITLLVLRIN